MAEAGETTAGAGARTAFISYASPDAAIANQVVGALERAGVSCWIAPRDVEPGALYADEIVRAINESRVVVLVLSGHSVASAHVGKELERASSKNKRIVALRTEATPLPRAFEYFLSESQWIEVGAGGIEPAAAKLAESVRRHLGAAPATDTGVVPGLIHPTAAPAKKSRALTLGIAAVLAAALAIGAVWKFWPAKVSTPGQSVAAAASAATAGATEDASIAVLPFVNMSSDKEQEFFADGLSEELLNQLAQIPKLRVIGRTSSFSFKGKNEDLRTIGKTLGVNHILEGSVRKSGNQLRITAQLINPADGSHLWSETYDRELKNVFEIQNEIAMAVSEKLKLTINGTGRVAGGTQNVAAYEAYLLGVSKYRTTKPAMYLQALKHFEEALRLDPDFDLAWASLISINGAIMAEIPEERAAAQQRATSLMQRALSQAPNSVAGSIARYRQAVANKDFATALNLAQAFAANSAADITGTGSFTYGSLLLAMGEATAAIDFFTDARRKDPLVGFYSTMKMLAHEVAGQFDLADQEYRVALAAPNANVPMTEGSALVLAMGRRDRPALERLLPRAIEAGPVGVLVNTAALKNLGDAPAARRELRRLIDDPGVMGSMYDMSAVAQWAAYFGDDTLALEALQRLSKMNVPFTSWALTLWRPVSQSTRRLPGFKTLVRDAGLVDYWRKSGQWNEFCKPVGADDFECR
jgi:TolB-like protein/tetratricopeptide (TPR) repeat protein